ncbi:MAG: sporulation integral membrane protein YtvI [Lachnospiraceae bacterium]|nr:sporulation integral membrane protein YtvI [Lachnospiraceae bacterium]
MKISKKYLKISINIATMIALVAFCIWGLPVIIRFMMPFIIAAIVALIAEPIVRFLEKHIKIKRKWGSAVVIILVLAIIGFICYAAIAKLVHEITGFVQIAPNLWNSMVNTITNVKTPDGKYLFNNMIANNREMAAKIGKAVSDAVAGGIETSINRATDLENDTNIAASVPNAIISIIMTILASYMFVADGEYIPNLFKRIVPEGVSNRWKIVTNSMKTAVGGYFSAQLKIMVVVYIILLIGLAILGVDYAALVALLIAVLDFLPFFGTGTVMCPWAIIAFLGSNYKLGVGLLITWGVSQLVRQLIQPKLLSDSMGLPPIPTLFLLYVGYKFGGALGLIFAVPAGMIIYNLYKAGVFSNFTWSIKMLSKDFTRLRRFTDEDLKNEGLK